MDEHCESATVDEQQQPIDSAATPLLDCFNCRHTVCLPPSASSSPSLLCDNCGLPLRLPAATDTVQPPPPLADAGSDGSAEQQLQRLLDRCGVCGRPMTRGPLCFLPCGHLIHERHRLVYRHCPLCAPHLPAYSQADTQHTPSAEEAEHYRRRKEAERARYGAEKGPCFPLFLEPSEVAHLLVYGDEEAVAEDRDAMERRTADMQREVREKQNELERQTAAEADTAQRMERRLEQLRERQSSLARRVDRSDNKRRAVDELRMDLYAASRECSTLERDIDSIAQHSRGHDESGRCDEDREALQAEDGASFAALARDDEVEDGTRHSQQAESARRRRTQWLQLGDHDATQSQLQTLHTRYTHLHNSRTRQRARNDKEHDALSKQHGTCEAAISAIAAEYSECANRLATVRCEVSAMERRRERHKRVNTAADTDTATRPQQRSTAGIVKWHSEQCTAPVESIGSSVLGLSPLRSRSASMSSTARSSAPPSRSCITPSALVSAATTRRSHARPSVPGSCSSVSVCPASSSSPPRRFPSFSATACPAVGRQLSGVDGKGGRVLLTASGLAVQAPPYAGGSKVTQAAGHGSRAAAEASRGALDRFVRTIQR